MELEKPDYIFIEGGVNDFIAGSECGIPQNNYMAMVHQAYHTGMIPVLVTAPPISPSEVRDNWLGMADYSEVFRKYEILREFLLKMSSSASTVWIFIRISARWPRAIRAQPGTSTAYVDPAGHEYIAGRVGEYLRGLGPSVFRP